MSAAITTVRPLVAIKPEHLAGEHAGKVRPAVAKIEREVSGFGVIVKPGGMTPDEARGVKEAIAEAERTLVALIAEGRVSGIEALHLEREITLLKDDWRKRRPLVFRRKGPSAKDSTLAYDAEREVWRKVPKGDVM